MGNFKIAAMILSLLFITSAALAVDDSEEDTDVAEAAKEFDSVKYEELDDEPIFDMELSEEWDEPYVYEPEGFGEDPLITAVMEDDLLDDTYVSERFSGTNYGYRNYFYAGAELGKWEYALLKAYPCPTAGYVTSAKLHVKIDIYNILFEEDFYVARPTSLWDEHQVDWNNRPGYDANSTDQTTVYDGDWFTLTATKAVQQACNNGQVNGGFYIFHKNDSLLAGDIGMLSVEGNGNSPVSYIQITYEAGCAIGGKVYQNNTVNPGNPCEICKTSLNRYDWSARNGVACNDGLYCNGTDTCSNRICSVHTGDPCPENSNVCDGIRTCNESTDSCNNGTPLNCNDGKVCTDDSCDPIAGCQYADNTDPCDDGVFCNGDDTCSGGTCSEHDGDPCGDDNIFCNGNEYCDTEQDECTHSGTPCPDDGEFCNGQEYCEEATDRCLRTDAPCGDDGVFCNGVESCDEEYDLCQSAGDPCGGDDGLWCTGEDWCDEEADECAHDYDDENPRCADDGLWCNGDEICVELFQECAHEFDEDNLRCGDDGLWCNGAESCDEQNDECASSGNPCDVNESCVEDTDECLTVDDDADDDTDDDTDDDADDDTTDDDVDDDDDDDTETDDDLVDDDSSDDEDDDQADLRSGGDSDSSGSGCGC